MYVVFAEELLQPNALSDDTLNFGGRITIPRCADCISQLIAANMLSAVALLKRNVHSAKILVHKSGRHYCQSRK
jgi:hypothetical protein